MGDLRDQLRSYYRDHQLPEDTLARLLGPASSPHHRQRHGRSIAAVLLAAVIGGVIGWFASPQPGPTLVGEITGHHATARAGTIEVRLERHAAINDALPDLDFRVSPSAVEAISRRLPGYGLVGANYCRVQGVQAVQLVYRHADSGALATAYLRPRTGDDLGRLRARLDSLRLQAWTDAEHFHAIVGADTGAGAEPAS